MNKLILYTACLLPFYSCKQANQPLNNFTINHAVKPTTPEAVLTADHLYWKAAAVTAATTILKAKFEKDGRFQFFYRQTMISGTVDFAKNKAGKNILIIHATNRTGHNPTKSRSKEELNTKYSTTYLWERISFPAMPSEDFLLLVDLDAHPEAGSGKPGCINKNWVSKFYLKQ